MTPQQLSHICSAVYFNPPERMLRQLYLGKLHLGPMCEALLTESPMSDCSRTELAALIDDPALYNMRVLRYENKNASSGMVAYGFSSPDGGVILAFRGSESMVEGELQLTDWEDNFLAPFVGSVQYGDIEEFAAAFSGEKLIFTGHSKGGHNAMYALATSTNERAHCICFDGQGFSGDALSQKARKKLKANAANIVCETDIVGVLLHHPEKRIFTKKQGNLNAHELCSLTFSEDGEPVPGFRGRRSYLIQLLSSAYVDGHMLLAGKRPPKWLMGLIQKAGGIDMLKSISLC